MLVMGILILGKYTPFGEQTMGTEHFLTGFAAGTIGCILGVWE